jgi:hypothetical protein
MSARWWWSVVARRAHLHKKLGGNLPPPRHGLNPALQVGLDMDTGAQGLDAKVAQRGDLAARRAVEVEVLRGQVGGPA